MRICALLLGALIACPSSAHEMTTILSLEGRYSNNALLLPPGQEVRDYWLIPGVSVDDHLVFPNLDGQLRYRATRTDYRKNTFSDRTDVLGEGSFQWTISDPRLVWSFYQNRNRLTVDSQDVQTPSNQTTRDVIQTGPSLRFQFGATRTLTWFARFARSRFDNGGLSSTRQRQYGLTFMQDVAAHTSVGLTAARTSTDSDTSLLKYTTKRIGLTAKRSGERIHYSLDVGRNTVDRDFGISSSAPFYSINASLTKPTSVWHLSANREITDSSMGLSLNTNVADPLSNGDSNFDSSDTVERSRFELSWNLDLVPHRSSIVTRLSFDRQDFQLLPRDRDTSAATVQFRFLFTPRSTIIYEFHISREKFETNTIATGRDRYLDKLDRLDFRYTPNPQSSFTIWTSYGTRDYEFEPRDYREIAGGFILRHQI